MKDGILRNLIRPIYYSEKPLNSGGSLAKTVGFSIFVYCEA